MNWLKLLYEALRFAWKRRRSIRDAAAGIIDETQPIPLTHKDSEHIRKQIYEATKNKTEESS